MINLTELSLEGNPFCVTSMFTIQDVSDQGKYLSTCWNSIYRATCVHMFPLIHILDSDVVTKEEREKVKRFYNFINGSIKEKNLNTAKIKRALDVIKKPLEVSLSKTEERVKKTGEGLEMYGGVSKCGMILSASKKLRVLLPFSKGITQPSATVGNSYRKVFKTLKVSVEDSLKARNKGFYEVQVPVADELNTEKLIYPEEDVLLHVHTGSCGNGWNFLFEGFSWTISTCSHLFVHGNNAVEETCRMIGSIEITLPRLNQMTFIQNSIESFNQESVKTLLLVINKKTNTRNAPFFEAQIINFISPIAEVPFFREYFGYHLPKIQKLNGREISEEERKVGTEKFALNSLIKNAVPKITTKSSTCHTSIKNSNKTEFCIANSIVEKFMEKAFKIVICQKEFEIAWPKVVDIFFEEIRDQLSNMNRHMDIRLKKIMKEIYDF